METKSIELHIKDVKNRHKRSKNYANKDVCGHKNVEHYDWGNDDFGYTCHDCRHDVTDIVLKDVKGGLVEEDIGVFNELIDELSGKLCGPGECTPSFFGNCKKCKDRVCRECRQAARFHGKNGLCNDSFNKAHRYI